MIHDDPSNTALLLDEQLVAYLDGELDPDSRRRIEELLASDAEVRRRLQEMERTWDLLDDLDTMPVGDQFTQTTLEMVAVAARDDVEQSLADAPRRRRRRRLAIGGGLLAVAAAGFFAAVIFFNPNRQLLQDLPLLENLDEYRQVGDIEFLRMLQQNGLFAKEPGETSPDAPPPTEHETAAERRQRVESMDQGEHERLLRLQERFDAFNRQQKEQLWRLDAELQKSRDALQLRQVMRRYGDWLKSLPSYARAELLEMSSGDRLKSVEKRLREEQQTRDDSRQPGGKDMEKLLKWMNEYAAAHEKQFLQTLPEEQRKRLTEWPPPGRYRWMFWLMSQRRPAAGSGKPSPLLTDADLAQLRNQLSSETRQRLESKPPAQQWQLVARWVRHAPGERPAHGAFRRPDDERLANFFEHDLPAEERDRLLSMSGEDMQRELQRLYLTRTRPPEGPVRRPDGRPHGNRFGDQRPAP